MATQFKSKCGAFSRPITVCEQRATHLFGRFYGAMKTETMTFLPRHKPMIENFGEVLRWNAYSIVDYGNSHTIVTLAHA
jgi:hypothetical protein